MSFRMHKLGGSDLIVPEVCLGTMTWGSQNSEAEAHQQLDYALSRGVNFIDTAEMYAVPPGPDTYTKTESIIGPWLKRQQRDKVILATKVAGISRGMDWIRGGGDADAKNIRLAVDSSLKRLQTDYIDLYQLHWPSRNVPAFGLLEFDPAKEREATPLLEQLETFAALIKEGKIRHIGVSNETPWGLMEWLRLAEKHNLPRIASIQNPYSLVHRAFDEGSPEICYREKIALLAYSPLAFGQLSGKYVNDAQAAGRLTRFDKKWSPRWRGPRVLAAARSYMELAREFDLAPATLAIAWVKSRWFVTSTIIGATSLEQLKVNIDAFAVTLPAEALKRIDELHHANANPAV